MVQLQNTKNGQGPRKTKYRRNISAFDSYARLSSAVYINAFTLLRKAVVTLEDNPDHKEDKADMESSLSFLRSDNPFKRYLEHKGHYFPIERTIISILEGEDLSDELYKAEG